MKRLRRLRLFARTMGYLRRDQAAHYFYRRVASRGSKPHRAADVPRVRTYAAVSFPAASGSKALDRLCLAGRDEESPVAFAGRTARLWRPLRIQIHYFDYLNDSERSEQWKREIVSDWIANNPRALGDGWTAYPTSLRMVNWIKFFVRLPAPAIEDRWLASLYDQALWLEKNLELHILANHYLKNAKALLFAGMFFEGTDADRWRDVGLRTFVSQMLEQFLADGGHYERSPMYHAISLEDILDVYTYLRTGARPENADVLETLRARAVAGLEFMSALQLPGGGTPLFNDSSDDVGPTPLELFSQARTVLGYEPPDSPAGLLVRALAPSGYYVIRDGASALVIDCGPLGPDYQPGHGHCDALSYELVLRGERVVVDTGVFDYEPNEQRRYARGTAAHNTVQIDGAEQSEIWDVFRVARRAKPLAASLELIGAHEAAFTGAHDGYERAPTRTIHHRTVRYVRGEWLFEDRLEGSGRHLIESRVHLYPEVRASLSGGCVSLTACDGRPIAILRASSQVDIRLESGPYFSRFGLAQERDVITMAVAAKLPVTLEYTISPHEG